MKRGGVSLASGAWGAILAEKETPMPQIVPNPPPGFDALSPNEQIEYVQALWDRIAATPEQVPVPDWHVKILRERAAKLESSADAGRNWEEVREDIEAKLRDSSSK